MRDELDLRLVDVAAFHASQSPVLIAPTHDDAALMILRRGLTLRSRNNLDQNYKLSPQRFIFDGGVGAQQSEAENAVDDEQAADVWFLAVTIVEKRYVDAELLSDFLELRRADPAEALFVFLHLMKGEAEVTGQPWLANRICAPRRDAGVKLTVRPVAPRDEMGTPQAGAGSMTEDGYRSEHCGAWIEYRNLGKALAHEGPLPHVEQDRPAVGDRTDRDRKKPPPG